MKLISKTLLLSLSMMMMLWSCKKDENQIFFEGGTAPVLTANKTTTIPLSFVNKDNEAITFSWTNPNYKFTTGNSSQDVSYTLEIDTTNATGTINTGFTYSGKQTITVSKDLGLSITQGVLNDYLLNQLQLNTTMVHYLQIRVIATLTGNNVPMISNVLRFAVTPYAIPPKVTPPASNALFLVGSATAGGWNNPVPVPSQQFTRVSSTLYEITVPITPGGSYLMLPVNGDWSAKFGGTGSSNNTNNVNGDDFRAGGSDLLAPSVSGNYKISVDFQRGKFTLTKL